MFLKQTRILILLLILAFVAMSTTVTRWRNTSWERPLNVIVYPVNGDNSQASAGYINRLQEDNFDIVEEFFRQEAESFDLDIGMPVNIILANEVRQKPPPPPRNGNVLLTMIWSLKLRYWAYKMDTHDEPVKDIVMFISYFDPGVYESLGHSYGLEKGTIGVVNAFATRAQAPSNMVVFAHELLHTLGATDKYDFSDNFPVHPQGYAEPDEQPLHPQRFAEIMGGRIPISDNQAEIPESLNRVVIGPYTAREINWIE
jgi:hypothetical protein